MAEQTQDQDPTDKVLQSIMEADETAYGEFIEKLNVVANYTSQVEISNAIGDAAATLGSKLAKRLPEFALGFGAVLADRGDNGFVRGASTKIAAGDAKAAEALEARLRALFGSRLVMLGSESTLAVRRHSRAIFRTWIDTDLRPVFIDSVGDPAAFVISSRLRIAWNDDVFAEDEEILEFALDAADLAQLAEQAQRALDQYARLTQTAERIGIPVISPEEETHRGN